MGLITIKAMAVQTFNPKFAIKSFNNLLSLCDDIWYYAGDKSSDVCRKKKIFCFLILIHNKYF